MSDPVVKATLPQAADLLERWFLTENWRDRILRVDTMRFLQACGKLKKLDDAIGTAQRDSKD